MADTTLYALSTCPYCRRAREFLIARGIPFDLVEVDLLDGEDRAKVVEQVERISGGTLFPVVVSGDQVIVGFDESRLSDLPVPQGAGSAER